MSDQTVLPGIDNFLNNKLYKNKNIGLITNQTGITSRGVPTWKALLKEGYRLKTLFGPEHGFRGEAQDAVSVEDSLFMGIKTYSLFGERLSPEINMLEEIDLLLYDIQDVGCRYYTYLYTLANTMEVCEKTDTKMVILDRPNPIGSFEVEGNIISPEYSSFLGGYGLPNIYGLTIGEFAKYLKLYYYKNIEMEVVPLQNYTKDMSYEETGLPWVYPSPNIPSLNTVVVYPGTCLFEGTNVSEGRGTSRPFEVIGAPWIDGENLREALCELALPGVVFSSLFFTPTFSKYKNVSCGGISIHIENKNTYRPLYTGIKILNEIYTLHARDFKWKQDWEENGKYFIDKLAGSNSLRKMMDANKNADSIYNKLFTHPDKFLHRREAVRLYSKS